MTVLITCHSISPPPLLQIRISGFASDASQVIHHENSMLRKGSIHKNKCLKYYDHQLVFEIGERNFYW